MMSGVLEVLLRQALCGGAVVALALLIRRALAGRISARAMRAMWLLVAMRLLVPLELPGVILPAAAPAVVETSAADAGAETARGYRAADASTAQPKASERTEAPSAAQTVSGGATAKTAAGSARAPWRGPNALLILWASGALLTSGYIALTNLRRALRLRRGALRLSSACGVPVYRAKTDSPCLCGFLRPRIYVNERAASADLLPYVLAHETAHRRAGDNFWLLLRGAIVAVYWFQPLVWVAASRFERDCEAACDERVTAALPRREQLLYARALVSLSAGPASMALASGMATKKRGEMNMRVSRILHPVSARRWLGAVAAVALALCSLFTRATGEARVVKQAPPDEFPRSAQGCDGIPSYGVYGGEMALLFEGKLYRGMGEDWRLMGEYPEATALCFGPEGLFLSEGASVARLDENGARETVYRLGEGARVLRMACGAGALGLIVESEIPDERWTVDSDQYATWHTGDGYLLNLQSGALTPLKTSLTLDICADESGSFCALHKGEDDGWYISRVSRDGETDRRFLIDYDVMKIAADARGVYCLNTNSAVVYRDFETGTVKRGVIEPDLRADAEGSGSLISKCLRDIQMDGGVAYVYKDALSWEGQAALWTGVLEAYDIEAREASGGRELTFGSLWGPLKGDREYYMQQRFAEAYPDVRLNYIDLDYTVFATQLMAGDCDVDILYAYGTSAAPYANSGALVPIDEMPGVADAIDRGDFVNFQPVFSWNGRLYGVPELLGPLAFRLNEPLLEKLGLTWPEAPYSWKELADWAIPALEGTDCLLLPFAFYDPVRQFTDYCQQERGEVILDDPNLRESLEAYRRLWQAGLVCKTVQSSMEEANLGRALADMGALDASGQNVCAMLPDVGALDIRYVETHGYFVVAGSEERDLAEAWLEGYMSVECQRSIGFGYPDGRILKDAALYQGYDDEWLVERGLVFLDADAEARRQWMLEKPVLYARTPGLSQQIGFGSVLNDYLDGKITIDEYIAQAQAQARLDLVQYE